MTEDKTQYKVAVEVMPRKNYQGVNVRIERNVQAASDEDLRAYIQHLSSIAKEESEKALKTLIA